MPQSLEVYRIQLLRAASGQPLLGGRKVTGTTAVSEGDGTFEGGDTRPGSTMSIEQGFLASSQKKLIVARGSPGTCPCKAGFPLPGMSDWTWKLDTAVPFGKIGVWICG